ncbi:hypothetical protein M407DRAFT_32808 [Tulasnella calospora MUT 4182]|uniref:Uncharacterized protein n=1 Tax=Tulasnella calospora MUT 4182 TaxID=1051891 RepID=A0A0C3PS59_9AGAM|nr:hypothetical protein M407DRAFT_32808 [Tulasnella calospora MUT 4182]
MARIDAEINDSVGPPAYNADVQPQPSPTYASVASQTDLTTCSCGHLTLSINLGSGREPAPCSACPNNPAIAPGTLQCGHSICSFHLSFFIDGLRDWQTQQAASGAHTSRGATPPPLVESLAALSLSTTIETQGSNGSGNELGASAHEGVSPPSAFSSTSDDTPFMNPDLEPVAVQSFIQPSSSSPLSVSPYPDPAPSASNNHSEEEQAPSTSPGLAPPLISEAPAQNPTPLGSNPSSPSSASNSSESSESSETSYGSWTSSVNASAHELMAVYEAREFGDQKVDEEPYYNDVEMHNAEGDAN